MMNMNQISTAGLSSDVIKIVKWLTVFLVFYAQTVNAAVIINSTSDWNATWNEVTCDNSGQCDTETKTQSESSPFGGTFDVGLPSGHIAEGRSSISFDENALNVKSNSNFSFYLDGRADEPWVNYANASVINAGYISDELTIPLDAGFIEIIVMKNGSFSHDLRILPGGFVFGELHAFSNVDLSARLGDEQGFMRETLTTDVEGYPNETEKLEQNHFSNHFSVLAPFNMFDGPVLFEMTYAEQLFAETYGFDANAILIDIINDLSHTVDFFAKVYDVNMNYRPDLSVTSSLGLSFQSPSTTSVNEPQALGLFTSALILMLCLFRQRHTE